MKRAGKVIMNLTIDLTNIGHASSLKGMQYAGIVFTMLLLTACNGNREGELDNYIADVHNRSAKPIKPIPAIKPYLRYVYPEHDKDPFDVSILAPVVSAAEEVRHIENGLQIDTTRVPEFLEGFTLDSLHMVGTVRRQGELWALVKIPTGGIQRLKPGNYIGKNFGKVEEVTTGKIKIKEIVPNGFGGYKPRENAISLASEE